MLSRNCSNIKTPCIRWILLPFLFLASLSAFAQTTSLVVNFDLRGFADVSHDDSFTMRYTNEQDSAWIFERSFHCSKEFSWSDTISPVPLGDVKLTILRGPVKVLESYYWVDKDRLNEYHINIDRQHHRSKGVPFISEDFVNFYFRVGANFADLVKLSNNRKSVSFSSGFLGGRMISKHFGISFGYGVSYETTAFDIPISGLPNRYNYWSGIVTPAVRFAPFTYENESKLRRNSYIDIGTAYYLPFRFTANEILGKTRTQYRGLHNFKDVRVRGSITIGQMSFFMTYRLNDIVKEIRFQETPRLIIGVGMTNQL
ncbi:MAG: hypothetical protein ACI8SE_000828 [Bacteroidia bacterium]|jgi:hypothetical protein